MSKTPTKIEQWFLTDRRGVVILVAPEVLLHPDGYKALQVVLARKVREQPDPMRS